MNKNKTIQLISVIILLIDVVLTLFFYSKLPNQIAIHWDSSGTPDKFASRFWGALSLIFIIAGVILLQFFFSKFNEFLYKTKKTKQIYSLNVFVLLLIIIALSVVQILSLFWNAHYSIKISDIGTLTANFIIGFIFYRFF